MFKVGTPNRNFSQLEGLHTELTFQNLTFLIHEMGPYSIYFRAVGRIKFEKKI